MPTYLFGDKQKQLELEKLIISLGREKLDYIEPADADGRYNAATQAYFDNISDHVAGIALQNRRQMKSHIAGEGLKDATQSAREKVSAVIVKIDALNVGLDDAGMVTAGMLAIATTKLAAAREKLANKETAAQAEALVGEAITAIQGARQASIDDLAEDMASLVEEAASVQTVATQVREASGRLAAAEAEERAAITAADLDGERHRAIRTLLVAKNLKQRKKEAKEGGAPLTPGELDQIRRNKDRLGRDELMALTEAVASFHLKDFFQGLNAEEMDDFLAHFVSFKPLTNLGAEDNFALDRLPGETDEAFDERYQKGCKEEAKKYVFSAQQTVSFALKGIFEAPLGELYQQKLDLMRSLAAYDQSITAAAHAMQVMLADTRVYSGRGVVVSRGCDQLLNEMDAYLKVLHEKELDLEFRFEADAASAMRSYRQDLEQLLRDLKGELFHVHNNKNLMPIDKKKKEAVLVKKFCVAYVGVVRKHAKKLKKHYVSRRDRKATALQVASVLLLGLGIWIGCYRKFVKKKNFWVGQSGDRKEDTKLQRTVDRRLRGNVGIFVGSVKNITARDLGRDLDGMKKDRSNLARIRREIFECRSRRAAAEAKQEAAAPVVATR